MQYPANQVVKLLAWGKPSVATFMRQNPQPGAKEALNKAIQKPSSDTAIIIVNSRDGNHRKRRQSRNTKEISRQVAERGNVRGLKAVAWNCITQVTDANIFIDSLKRSHISRAWVMRLNKVLTYTLIYDTWGVGIVHSGMMGKSLAK